MFLIRYLKNVFFKRAGTKPISPYNWVQQNIEYFINEIDVDYDIVSKKIMMGIPYYGFKIENNKMGHLLGNEYFYLNLLKTLIFI